MARSAVTPVLERLCDLLRERSGLAGVAVLDAPYGTETPREAIVFLAADADQEWGSIGKRRKDEDITLNGAVWIVQPGAGPTAIKSVRDRAYALVGEVEDQLREDHRIDGLVVKAALTRTVLEQGLNTEGRWAQVTFWIRAEAWLPAS